MNRDVVFPDPESSSREAAGKVKRKREGKKGDRRREKHPQEPTSAPDSDPEKKGVPSELRGDYASRKSALNEAMGRRWTVVLQWGNDYWLDSSG